MSNPADVPAPSPSATGGPAAEPLGVALFGLGTVGGGVAERLLRHPQTLTAGRPLSLKHAVVRDVAKNRGIDLPAGVLHDDMRRAVDDPAVAIGVELIGGIPQAFELCRDLLRAGKHVVTANKALICERGPELFALAAEHGRMIRYEAAVAGGVPIVAGLTESLAANRITGIRAILNGTSNFLLSRMADTGASYADALAEAQKRGYAEADPSMDVDGTDAAQKLVILSRLAFGAEVTFADVSMGGIDVLDAEDLSFAEELGCAVKLLAVAKRTERGLELSVRPTLVRRTDAVANINGPMNVVAVRGDLVGDAWFAGPGAGREPTASAVLADLLSIAAARPPFRPRQPDSPLRPVPADELFSRFYLRFRVVDRPHVFAALADILGSSGISLASIIQHAGPEADDNADPSVVSVVVMTHRTSGARLRAAAERWAKLESLRGEPVVMLVAD
ncbi:homoserine dehydrogenase [Alienimonas californiensis]|uniref:Homoserine dehydrogenase n=1 Tax=Alienimonas californiensis TaxID=2527989 RepID=A0A517PDR9_9PLAN|nr:homoserine dehydrogenase [Alienimonas californiensis]QDT17481.1 Homoserine dehydrogenase [Alienimonas californiensis]